MSLNRISRRRFLQASAAAGTFAGTMRAGEVFAQGATKVLRARAYISPEVLDPGWRLNVADGDIMTSIFSGLVTFKPGEEWAYENDIAAEVKQESPTRIRFQLKPGYPWSNGFGEVTAEDVKYSYERIANPAMKAAYRVDWEKLDKVELTGTHSGVIVLKEPYVPLWNSTLPAGSGLIMCKKAVEKLDGQRFTVDPPATCGPYRIRKFEKGRSVVLERNPDWPGPKPAYDEIQFIVVVDANAAELAFDAGELDITQVPIGSVPRLKAKLPAGARLVVKPALAYIWLGMQSEDGPFKDMRVRKAVQLAVDVNSVLDGAFFGVATPSTGIIAPGLAGHREKKLIDKRDLAQAKKLLAEAGLAGGFKTEIQCRNSAEYTSAAQVIAANLAEIGITAEVTPIDSGAQHAMAIDVNGGWKKMQMVISRFTMQPDPAWATAWFVSSQIGVWNYERIGNAEFDKLHTDALSELDPAKRTAMYQRMQDLMEESGAYVFLTHGVNAIVHRDTVKPALSPDAGRFIFPKFAPA
ncbi:MAG: peptide ABC transporter substrate-binding protein [Proteobacteria bacterium]|nr:peptide ABC transporter substrate-binding protein [Pseudomonadota bacterium]MBI3505760.1 peptide ABC transporter substrate-binding protein [Pseudomonadota bacterium]